MSYPALQDDIRWLRFQAEIAVKIDNSIGGITDAVRINRGRTLLIVNTDPFGDVFCWYTKIETLNMAGADAVVTSFSNRVKEHRKNQS